MLVFIVFPLIITRLKPRIPQYYENALLFLKSVNQSSLPIKEQVERAHDLALSALMGEGLYNFGELVIIYNLVVESYS